MNIRASGDFIPGRFFNDKIILLNYNDRRMDNITAKLFAAEMDEKIPTLDLHGFYPKEATVRLDVFLYENFNKKVSAVRVIYGAGTGRLRASVLDILDRHGLVAGHSDEGSSVVVVLSPPAG